MIPHSISVAAYTMYIQRIFSLVIPESDNEEDLGKFYFSHHSSMFVNVYSTLCHECRKSHTRHDYSKIWNFWKMKSCNFSWRGSRHWTLSKHMYQEKHRRRRRNFCHKNKIKRFLQFQFFHFVFFCLLDIDFHFFFPSSLCCRLFTTQNLPVSLFFFIFCFHTHFCVFIYFVFFTLSMFSSYIRVVFNMLDFLLSEFSITRKVRLDTSDLGNGENNLGSWFMTLQAIENAKLRRFFSATLNFVNMVNKSTRVFV